MKPAKRPNWGRLAVIIWLLSTVYFLFFPLYKISPGLSVAKEARCEADIANIAAQLETFHKVCRAYPTQNEGLKALVIKPEAESYAARWRQLMDSIPLDPWGREYQYRFPAAKSREPYDLYSLGKPSQLGTEIGNWQSQ